VTDTTRAGFATEQIRAGYTAGTPQNAAVPPIYQTVGYEFESFAAAREIFALRRTGNLYSRTGNPTQSVLEQRMARLDGGVAALATASGQSAVAVALLTLARAGDHIVAARQLYGGTVDLLTDLFPISGSRRPWSTRTTSTPGVMPHDRTPARSSQSPSAIRWPLCCRSPRSPRSRTLPAFR
jgi:O-acetylhomoserine (thiol)-lyase